MATEIVVEFEQIFKPVVEYILKKICDNLVELRSTFPFITDNGKWEICEDEDWDSEIFNDGYWCNGFWIGMLWLAYKVTQKDEYKGKAYELCRLIEPRKDSNKIHDLGFLFYPSFCLGHDIVKDNYLKSVALTAAKSLLSRFNNRISAITVSGNPKESGLTAIDTMMNLPLLWWGYEKTGDQKYYEAACKHATTTIRHFVRDDGSTYHVVEFDPDSGQVIKKTTLQGYNTESCWSRGQAWAIYGFTLAYKYAKKKEFLRTVEKLVDYYITNCPSDYVPYWDFNDPEIPNTVRDSSAAAITASGLLDLSDVEPDKQRAGKYEEMAYKILGSLTRNYLSKERVAQGVLIHGCLDKSSNVAIDSSLIWGDYYYIGALTKLIARMNDIKKGKKN